MNFNYDRNKAKHYAPTEQLPVGGYVCTIKAVKIEKTSNGNEFLNFLFDICEGEKTGFFENQYRTNINEDKKWKGTFKLWLPKYDNSEVDEKTIIKLNTAIADIEDSNPGYHFDSDEKKLVGKKIGVLFNEGEYNSHRFSKAYKFIIADDVRNGKFDIWQPELTSAAPASSSADYAASNDDDLPF